jgi:uncharacterized protein YbjQ (UPF0145 family)
MIVTTTESVAGRAVRAHLGVVAGERVFLLGFHWGVQANLRDLEEKLGRARLEAEAAMSARAAQAGADAVVGARFSWSRSGNVVVAQAVGTAVSLA